MGLLLEGQRVQVSSYPSSLGESRGSRPQALSAWRKLLSKGEEPGYADLQA